jgi:CheY-like chemotaxis protein
MSESPHRKKVLYVEDDDSAWRVAHAWLRDGFVLVRARDDGEACVMLRQFGSELSGLMCDVNLGGPLTGIALALAILGRSRGPLPDFAQGLPKLDIPVVIITGDAHRAAEARAEGLTVFDKPVDFPSLVKALHPPHVPAR